MFLLLYVSFFSSSSLDSVIFFYFPFSQFFYLIRPSLPFLNYIFSSPCLSHISLSLHLSFFLSFGIFLFFSSLLLFMFLFCISSFIYSCYFRLFIPNHVSCSLILLFLYFLFSVFSVLVCLSLSFIFSSFTSFFALLFFFPPQFLYIFLFYLH